jgi:hypothetical protein
MNKQFAIAAAALATIACTAALGQSSADPAEIMRRSFEHESLNFDPPAMPNYTYTIIDKEQKLNPDGSVKSVISETREVINLYGGHFERVIARNGQDLPANKAAAEQARFDEAVEKQKRAVQQWQASQTEDSEARVQEAAKKSKEKRMACNEGFLKMFDLAVVGTEALNGRTAWIIEMKPHSNAAPLSDCGGDLKMFGQFHIKMWVDQEDYRWARFEADNVGPVNYGKILFRVPTGALYALWEQVRNEDGVWLVTHDRIRVMARLMLAVPIRVDETDAYSGYRKYQADSRIVTDEGK